MPVMQSEEIRPAPSLTSSRRIFASYAFSSVFLTAATISSGFLVLRWLKPADVGVWQTLLVVQAYLTLTRLGIPNALNRELPFHLGSGEKEIAHRYTETTLLHALVAGGFCSLVLLACWPFFADHGNAWQWGIPAAAIMVGSMSYRTYLYATMRSSVDFRTLSYLQVGNGLTALLAPLVVWRYGFAGFCVHAAIETTVITGLAHRARPIHVHPRWHSDTFRALLKSGIHLFVTSYLFTAALTFDRLVLLMRGDVTLVGLYAPALAVASAMTVLPNAVGAYAYPRLSFAHGRGAEKAELWRVTSKSMWTSGLLGIPIAIVTVLVLPSLTKIFVPEYVASIRVMQYAAVSGVFMGITAGTAILRSLQAWRPLYFFIVVFVIARWSLPYAFSLHGDPLMGVAIGNLSASAVAAAMTWIVARRAILALDR